MECDFEDHVHTIMETQFSDSDSIISVGSQEIAGERIAKNNIASLPSIPVLTPQVSIKFNITYK